MKNTYFAMRHGEQSQKYIRGNKGTWEIREHGEIFVGN
jgi:hypothetical protein